MKKGLVKQFKAEADNNNLPLFGCLSFGYSSNTITTYTNALSMNSGEGSLYFSEKECFFCNAQGEKTSDEISLSTSVASFRISSGEDILILNDNYRIGKLDFNSASFSFDISQLVYREGLVFIRLKGDGISGDISCLNKLVNLENLSINSSQNIDGDISALSTLINITNINLQDTNVGGSYESLLNELAKTKSNGDTLAINCKNTAVTYQGTAVGNVRHIVTFDGNNGYTVAVN